MKNTIINKYKNAAEVDIAPVSGKITKIVKYRSKALGHGACLKVMSRTITKQGFTLTAITDAEKMKLQCELLTDGLTHRHVNRQMEVWIPISQPARSHPAISRCDKNQCICILGFTGVTHLLQRFKYCCLFQWAMLSQALECVGTDFIYLQLFSCPCKNSTLR